MRDNYILVCNGNKWQLKEKDDLLQNIVYINTDILSDKFDELLDHLDDNTK